MKPKNTEVSSKGFFVHVFIVALSDCQACLHAGYSKQGDKYVKKARKETEKKACAKAAKKAHAKAEKQAKKKQRRPVRKQRRRLVKKQRRSREEAEKKACKEAEKKALEEARKKELANTLLKKAQTRTWRPKEEETKKEEDFETGTFLFGCSRFRTLIYNFDLGHLFVDTHHVTWAGKFMLFLLWVNLFIWSHDVDPWCQYWQQT